MEALATLRDQYEKKTILTFGLLDAAPAFQDLDAMIDVEALTERELKHRKSLQERRAQSRAASIASMVCLLLS